MAKFYITSAIPYVNAPPHVGHALEFVQADTIARYHKLLGYDVLLLSGGDENALKNVQAAEKADRPIQAFVDENTQKFLNLTRALHCLYDIWQKGSDQKHHFLSSQTLWNLCLKAGDIYKKSYEGLYCVGCEVFYAPDELDKNGECLEHPGKKLEKVFEENYFFRLSKYESIIKEKIASEELSIIPDTRRNEVLSFLKRGLEDISISRTSQRAKNWGVPVPNDPTQRMYVWFDALNIYQSGVGFGWNDAQYKTWWPADVHVIGKGITRFHAIYWPAFLLSAGLSLPKKIFVHEYFTVNGQKMSKTVGNVINPITLINKYGAEPLRYYFLAKFSPFNDGDFSEEEFKKTYNADLANGLGNLIARVAKLCEKAGEGKIFNNIHWNKFQYKRLFDDTLKLYEFNKALALIWEKIKKLDQHINNSSPWKLSLDKVDGEALNPLQLFLVDVIVEISEIAHLLQPFLPETSKKILDQFENKSIHSKFELIKSGPPLFPRIL